MAEPTLEERVTRLEQLVDRAVAVASRTAMGRIILAKLGIDNA